MKTVGKNIGDSLKGCMTHIQYHILVEQPDDIELLKFDDKRLMNSKISNSTLMVSSASNDKFDEWKLRGVITF